jgi:hypothetical protein
MLQRQRNLNTPTIPESINPEIIRDAARRLYPQQEILARL